MKKTYRKPTMNVVTFEVNEAIASCTIKVFDNFGQNDCGWSEEGALIFSDYLGEKENLFGEGEDCKTIVAGYCYFTSSGDTKFLMNS